MKGVLLMEKTGNTVLCGIINATPDSFSDGGEYNTVEEAVERAGILVNEGITMFDIGGESTRPGSERVSAEEEIRRIVPVIRAIRQEYPDIKISVDTFKAETAKAAMDAGANIINDITGFLGDPLMADVVRDTGAEYVLMFNPVIIRPNHEGSKIFPDFFGNSEISSEDLKKLENLPITEMMKEYFELAIDYGISKGINREKIILDPGIGFGLTKAENFTLLKNLDLINKMGYRSFVGVSRKRFIVNILNEQGYNIDLKTECGKDMADIASAYLTAITSAGSADILRVHTGKFHSTGKIVGNSIKNAEILENRNYGSYRRQKWY